MSVDENIPPDQHRQSSQYPGSHMPFTVQGPIPGGMAPTHDPTMPPPPLPLRRTSAHDASSDFMRATYPPALPLPPPDPPLVRERSPRMFLPARQRRKGKGKALNVWIPPPPAGEVVGRCRWDPGFGYVCEICARICPKPAMHRANVGGTGCLDFSGDVIPLKDDVEEDVMRDPARALAEAIAFREASLQKDFGVAVQGAMEGVQSTTMQPQMWPGEAGPATVAFGRSGSSVSSAPQFTTASQIAQWAGGPQGQAQQQGGWEQCSGAGMFF